MFTRAVAGAILLAGLWSFSQAQIRVNPPLGLSSASGGFTCTAPGVCTVTSINGATFAAPGAIGGGTPSTGAFTTLTTTGNTTIGNGTGAIITTINGAASGNGNGAAIYFQNNGATNTAIGNASAILGGAFSTDLLLYNGSTGAARVTTSQISIIYATDATSTSTGALQIPGGMSVNKRVFMNGVTASAGLQTAVFCQASTGEVIADSVACLASAARFKNVGGPMADGALDKLMRLPIDVWSYKAEGNFTSADWTRERIGPLADDVAMMDPRLAGYDSDGNVRSYSTEQLLAFTIKALQELKADNDNLRAEMRAAR